MYDECGHRSPLVDKDEYLEVPRCSGLDLIRYLIANRQYDFTGKALDAFENGEFELLDLEHAVLRGRLTKKEADEKYESEGFKYIIVGKDTHGYDFYCCGKVVKDSENECFYLVITAHEAD